jgi:hypothetical protein
MASEDQTWIVLHTLIQEAFQRRLNAAAPTADHHRYTYTMPHQQNAFGALAEADSDNNTKDTVATQVTDLTYQSQVTAPTAANSSQRQEQHQYMQLALQRNMMHENLHKINVQDDALSCNASDAGWGHGKFGGSTCTRGHFSPGGRGPGPPAYTTGNFPAIGGGGGFPHGLPPGGPPPPHHVSDQYIWRPYSWRPSSVSCPASYESRSFWGDRRVWGIAQSQCSASIFKHCLVFFQLEDLLLLWV